MDKMKKYREIVKNIFAHYEELFNRYPVSNQETEIIFDEKRDQYLLLTVGWKQKRRIWGATLHVRLQDGKIWIEEDGLEDGITPDLLEAGVPKEDIVLGFHHPEVRPFTEFAVQ
ncbi:MAG: XisI protein [Anaerolineales bacterium]|nr:XisI protein [Anaerolineales bacterium]